MFDAIGCEFGYRPLAKRIGMDHTRLRRLIRGGGTSADAIHQVADALRVTPATIRELRGEDSVDYEPFILPDDAGRLNDKERDAIRAVVRALIDAKDSHHADQSTDRDGSTPPQNAPTPANVIPEVSPDDTESALPGINRVIGQFQVQHGDNRTDETG
jgi:hypothetical protein